MGKEAEEYVMQRELRIAQNKARMDALRLPTIASGLMGSGGKEKITSPKDTDASEDPDFHPASNDDDDDSSSDNSGYSNEADKVDHLLDEKVYIYETNQVLICFFMKKYKFIIS